jgi:hypothetical protein
MAFALLFLNFFVPLQAAAVLLLGVILIALVEAVFEKIAFPKPSLSLLFIGLAALIFAWFADGNALTAPFIDSGLYYFFAIALAQQETLPLALAKLHL